MTAYIRTHSKEDPWKQVCPACNGALWELFGEDGGMFIDGLVREHHYTCDSCGLSFDWFEWLEVGE